MSQQPEHTPGPWTYGDDGISGCSFVPEPPTADTPHGLGLRLEADARLIAAAPDLLAALRAICEAGDAIEVMNALPTARAAIAKAEGVSHVTA